MLTPFKSNFITDTGISTGDEGKGRVVLEIINELRALHGRNDIIAGVMKVNGGSNSGHTIDGMKLNLLPGGVADPHVESLIIGSGVVADPRKFLWESTYAEDLGHDVLSRLAIDYRCQVSDFNHRLLDLAWEDYRVNELKELPRGSTGRGITPSYSDEVSQFQIFYSDFLGSKENFMLKMRYKTKRASDTIRYVCKVSEKNWYGFFEKLTNAEISAHKDIIKSGKISKEEFRFKEFIKNSRPFEIDANLLGETYWEAGQKLTSRITDIRELVLAAKESNRYIIGEFGQAYWLDKRHGFPPNVTASHTFTPEFFQSAGVPVQEIHNIGCCKAYDTKVGTHTFLTEIEENHPLKAKLKKLEFGATTGRQRMVGWYDAVEKGDALRYGGFEDLIINKLDALSLPEALNKKLKVCIAYIDQNGKEIYHVPKDDNYRKSLKPIYQEIATWEEDISDIREYNLLPKNAKLYIAWMLKSLIYVANYKDNNKNNIPNLRYIGVGPNPNQIIKDIPDLDEILKCLED